METPPNNTGLDYFQAIAQVGTWVLVVLGWIIVNRQNNKRESRKEVRGQLDQVSELLVELEEMAVEYHTAQQQNAKLARSIKHAITRLTNVVHYIGLADARDFNRRIVRLRRTITLKNFDSANHQPVVVDGDFLENISSAAQDLIDLLERRFMTKYPRL